MSSPDILHSLQRAHVVKISKRSIDQLILMLCCPAKQRQCERARERRLFAA